MINHIYAKDAGSSTKKSYSHPKTQNTKSDRPQSKPETKKQPEKKTDSHKTDTFIKTQSKPTPITKITYDSKGKQELNSRAYSVQVSSAAGGRAEASVGIVSDKSGNKGIVVSAGFGVGTPSSGAGITRTDSSLKNIKEWNGFGGDMGASANVLSRGSVGKDIIIGNGCKVVGTSETIAGTMKPIPVEGHMDGTYTKVIPLPNDKAFENADRISKKHHKHH